MNKLCKECKNAHFYNKSTNEIVGDVTINYGKGCMKCKAHNVSWTVNNGELIYCSKFEKKVRKN